MTEDVSKLAAPNHSWVDRGSKVPALHGPTPSGCEEHERECRLCFLTKITIHRPHGVPLRAWRTKNGTRWIHPRTPLCEVDA